jgi:hypothetical protein
MAWDALDLDTGQLFAEAEMERSHNRNKPA